MFTIGEFSRITGLTVKALRFYHDEGLLLPTCVDEQTGYRYYAESKVELALAIVELRRLEFSVQQIADLLARIDDDADLLDELERHKQTIDAEARRFRRIGRDLDRFISHQREVRTAMQTATLEFADKSLPPLLVAGIRTRGRYRDCGPLFGQLCRKVGRHAAGPPMMLCYDTEFREDDADFEVAVPIRKPLVLDGAAVHELPAATCLTLVHRGPYEDLGNSYAKALAEVHRRGVEIDRPTREIYLKGPGIFFRGNPKKYLTELQFPLKS
ncbi:MAG: MerR family transcriptional regulator [Planctomycetota bacterium]|nr:MAG: MerR family transcriptional regulator [Planctomycetota bacterium]